MVAHVADDGLQHGGAVRRFADAHDERNGVRALRASRISPIRRMEKLFIERQADLLREFGKLFGVIVFAEERSGVGHDFHVFKIKCRGGERDGRELRDAGMFRADVIPVAQAIVDDVIVRAAAEVGDVVFHRVVMDAEQIQVAVELVLLPRHQDEGGAPFRRVTEYSAQMLRVALVAENRVFRRDGRHEAVGELRIGDVIHRLGEQLREVKLVAQRRAVQVIFLQPAELFTVRTVRHQADHVAALRPADELADAVEQGVRTFKFAGRFGRGIDYDAFQRFDFRQRAVGGGWSEMRLLITAARVEKLRRPSLLAVGGLGEFAPVRAAMARAH